MPICVYMRIIIKRWCYLTYIIVYFNIFCLDNILHVCCCLLLYRLFGLTFFLLYILSNSINRISPLYNLLFDIQYNFSHLSKLIMVSLEFILASLGSRSLFLVIFLFFALRLLPLQNTTPHLTATHKPVILSTLLPYTNPLSRLLPYTNPLSRPLYCHTQTHCPVHKT